MRRFPAITLSGSSRWKYLQGITILLLALYSILQVGNNGDFKVFLEAADTLRNGTSPYHVWFVHHNCLYLYSPFFATVLMPFTYLPDVVPNGVWMIALWFFTFRSIQLIKKLVPYAAESDWQKKLLVLIPFALTLRFWLYNIELLQMTLFILWCVLEGYHLCTQKKYLRAGLIIALGINIKILPIVLVPYLLLRGHWKVLPPLIFFSFVMLLFPALFFGFDFNLLLHKMWWTEINPASGSQYAIESDLGPQSLNALIPSLLMPTNGDLPLQRNLFDVPLPLVMTIVRAAQLLLIGFTLYFTGIRIRSAQSGIHAAWELSYILLIVPLIFPHQQKYAFFLCLPASMYITWFLMNVYNQPFRLFPKWKWKWMIALVAVSFVLMTLTTDGLIGINANQITQHYKLITYGCLLLGTVLAICHPKYVIADYSSSIKTAGTRIPD